MSAQVYDTLTGRTDLDVRDFPNNTIENVLIRPDGEDVRIIASIRNGSATIRNVGIEGPVGNGFNNILQPQARGANGLVTIENVFVSNVSHANVTGNYGFVNRHHAGHIQIRNSSFVGSGSLTGEDAWYASSPGNPGMGVKPLGAGGTVEWVNCFAENLTDYVFRAGSPGSRIIGCTIRGDINKATANLFGGEFDGYSGPAPNAPGAVTIEDCDIGGDVRTGVQVGSHQADKQAASNYATITEITNCRIEANDPIRAYPGRRGGTHYPIINGSRIRTTNPSLAEIGGGNSSNPDLTIPDGAPRSAVEAASAGEITPPPPPPPQEKEPSQIGNIALLGALLLAAKKRDR